MTSGSRPNPTRSDIGRLYEETGFLVLRRCVKMLGDRERAMDVTQWTYLRAVEVDFEIRSRAEALSWLYRTANLRCLTLMRNERSRRRIQGQHVEELRGPVGPSPEGRAVDRDLLQQAIARVEERTAEIALLTWGQGMEMERAAEVCGVSVRTVARERKHFAQVLQAVAQERGDEP